MPEDLTAKLNELETHIEKLRNEIKTSGRMSKAVQSFLLPMVQQIEDWKTEFATLLESSSGAPIAVREAAENKEDKGRPIEEFFEEVATGVVKTQKALDDQSRRYISETDPLMPVSFRMPKASAELSFGFGSEKSSGFNIIIASDTEEERKTMQHKVSFDIVAAPPPPDYMARLSEQSAVFPFIGGKEARKAIHLKLQAYAGPKSDDVAKVIKSMIDQFSQVICFADETHWILLQPTEDGGKHAIHLGRLSHDGTQFEGSANNKQASFDGKFSAVYALLTRIQDQQASAEG